MYVLDKYTESVTGAGNSVGNKRCWLVVHTTNCLFSSCAWYRPLKAGEIDSISKYDSEFAHKTQGCLGHIMLGDVNVHSKRRLAYSNGETPEGRELSRVCDDLGLDQHAREPTRCRDSTTNVSYLLDLCLSNVGSTKCKALQNIADHCVVEATVQFSVPTSSKLRREMWCFAKADWGGLRESLVEHDWSFT